MAVPVAEGVPFLDLVATHRDLEDDLVAVFRDVLRSAEFVGGPQVPHSPADFISVKQAGIVDPAVTKLQVAMTR